MGHFALVELRPVVCISTALNEGSRFQLLPKFPLYGLMPPQYDRGLLFPVLSMSLRTLSAAVFLTGCLILPEPKISEMPVPETFEQAADNGDDVDQRWWHTFHDSVLDELIDRALKANFDLKIAAARLEQAEAVAAQGTSALWPQLSLDSRLARTKRLVFGAGGSASIEGNLLNGSVAVAYEVDLWGKLRSLARAADLESLANEDALQSSVISISATVTDTWFNWLLSRARSDVTRAQLKTNTDYLELTQLRYIKGLATTLDVLQQKQEVAASQAQFELIAGDLASSLHQLNILLGEPPSAPISELARARHTLPKFPGAVGVGLPAQLLERRPDIRAARRRLIAADYRVGAAIADLLPAIRLGASMGFSAITFATLFDDFAWNLFTGIAQPLFEGGRRKYELDRNKALLKERLFDYKKVVLTALGEVESALAQEKAQISRLKYLRKEEAFARAALVSAKDQYSNGLVDFLRVLSATQALQRLELNVLQAERDVLGFRIQLHRALGGSWMHEESAALLAHLDDAPSDPVHETTPPTKATQLIRSPAIAGEE